MKDQLWIVGQVKDFDANAWEFQGVFSTEQLAVDACRDEMYFVLPATLDESLPHDNVPAPDGAYYPKHPNYLASL